MRYGKLLATLLGAGAIAAALVIPAQGTAPSQGSHPHAIPVHRLHLPMCHQTRVGSCTVRAPGNQR
jgi:hypothetical protein